IGYGAGERLSAAHALSLPGRLLLPGDRLCRALPGPRVRVRPLSANRQALAVTQAAIAAQIHQALDIHGNFAPQITLDRIIAVDRLANLPDLEIGKLVNEPRRRDADPLADLLRKLGTDAVNILKADDDALLRRNVHA